MGDLKRGRTVRSLSRLLTNFDDVKLLFISPEEFKISSDLREHLVKSKIHFTESTDFEGGIREADAIYMTRIQDEWDKPGDKQVDISTFNLNYSHLKVIKENCHILHPLPRREEIDPNIDKDPRAKYWRQERNGMWTRVALITMLMQVDHHIVLPEL